MTLELMTLEDRLTWALIGCVIGFVLGYATKMLRDIKLELDRIDKCVHGCETARLIKDEKGFMRIPNFRNFKLPKLRDVALFLVVMLTFYSAVMSQLASNKSNDTSERIIRTQDSLVTTQSALASLQIEQKQNLDCTTQVLFDAIRALNERTAYSAAQIDANIELVQAQLDLLVKGRNPNLSLTQQEEIYDNYVDQVRHFVKVAEKNKDQLKNFPFPTVEDLTTCLAQTSLETDEPKGE